MVGQRLVRVDVTRDPGGDGSPACGVGLGAGAGDDRLEVGDLCACGSERGRQRVEIAVEEINKVIKEAAEGGMKGVLAYTDKQLVSIDYNHDPASSTYDSTLTRVTEGTLVKVCSWYDNEWGFSNRMLDTTVAWAKAS